jgi:outer membrane protein assembly factor BamB
LSGPAKIALPATIANAMNQERILRALEDDDESREIAIRKALGTAVAPTDSVEYIASRNGNYGFATRLIERRLVERVAMKEPPKKSALDGNVNVTQSLDIANELLNEMQRDRGGDKVVEDESLYLATVHSMDSKVPDWTGDMIGEPQLLPLQTVTIVAGRASMVVLDKSNKKLWEAKFTHKIPQSRYFDEEEGPKSGEFPCAERDGRVYVCDEAMLTAFDAKSGEVVWRLPTVGVAGVLFDDAGMLYVNTTTASPDSVKYSRQIDVSKAVSAVIMKVDSKTGKALWRTQAGGFISYLSGKYIYVASWNDADDLKDSPFATGLETPSYVRVKRIDPEDGRIRWDYHKTRAPIAVHFDENQIQIVYKKEMQVLRYVAF